MRYANYVGRVGSLAIALGVGLSIVGTAGTASATPGDTGSQSDSAPPADSAPRSQPAGTTESSPDIGAGGRTHKRSPQAPAGTRNGGNTTATEGHRPAEGTRPSRHTAARSPLAGATQSARNTPSDETPGDATASDETPAIPVDETPATLDSGKASSTAEYDVEDAVTSDGEPDPTGTLPGPAAPLVSATEPAIPTEPGTQHPDDDNADVNFTGATSPTNERATAPEHALAAATEPAPAGSAKQESVAAPGVTSVVKAGSQTAATPAVANPVTSVAPVAPTWNRAAAATNTLMIKLERLASNLLNLIGLRPSARGAPVAPTESPLMLAALAWGRRQTQQPFLLSLLSGGVTTARVAAAAAPTNSVPVASTPTFGTPDSVSGAITGSLNVTDANGDVLTYSVTSAPAGGKLVLSSNGSFIYTPSQATRVRAGASLGPDVDPFTVSASDGKAAITVTVSAPVYSGQLSSATISPLTSGASPSGIAVYGNRIYVANTAGNSITAIDGPSNTVLATIGVGVAPTSLTVSPDGNTLYVTNSGSNTITAMSTLSGAIIANIGVGARPQSVAVNPAGSRLYVANTSSNNVTVLNTTTGATVATIAVGTAPTGIAVSPNGARVYVVNRSSGTVSAINTTTNKVVATMKVGTTPQSIALSSDGSRLYVTNSGSNNVSVLNASTGGTIATIAVGINPYGAAMSRDGSLVYVANSDSTVSLIDTKTSTKVTGTLRTETGSGSMIAMSADGTRAYVTNTAGTTLRATTLVHAADPPPTNVVPPSPLATTGFVDNFTGAAGTRPNSAIWGYHLGAGGDGGQLEAFTDSTKNASLDGTGNLAITAIREPIQVPGFGTFNYSSAFLTTQGKLDFTYGTIAASIKMPVQQGLTSAFWALGSDIQAVGWPTGGEIDIVELANNGTYGGSTLHGPGGYALPVQTPVDIKTGYHTFWMHWEHNLIVTGVDNTTLAVYTPDSLSPGTPWTFNDRSMFAILSLHVGGPYGTPDSSTVLPASMLVDWLSYSPLAATT